MIIGLHPLLRRHISKLSELVRVLTGEVLDETTDMMQTVQPRWRQNY